LKKVPSRHTYIIDSGYALRVMLEFYRNERKNRFKLLRESFDNNNYSMNYKHFHKVLQLNFANISEVEIATLFRESFALS